MIEILNISKGGCSNQEFAVKQASNRSYLETVKTLSQLILLTTLLLLYFSSCKKKGCTDCNATNYNIEAEEEDASCVYANEDLLGVYSVQDSITGPPTLEWYFSTYDLEISKSECAPNHLTLTNYANKNNTFSGALFSIDCQVINAVITIPKQDVNEDHVRESSGYFSNDSISFEIEYENAFGEVFYGKCFGRKK
ncbi:MAG: hypothetical protein HQ500_08280 [Flavobacteriales bacterium]|nr:hypothetical protein [Flavobacteriales bacterium]